MKRGIIINIIIVVVLLLPILATLGLAAGSDWAAQQAGCDTSTTPFSPEAQCSGYYSGVFLGALASMFTLPLSGGLLALYFVGLLIAWGVAFFRGRQAGKGASPVLSGMLLCSLALLGLGGLGGGAAAGVEYYRSQVVGACEALPQAGAVSGANANGALALGVLLPEPQGRPEQYVGQVIDQQGALLKTIKDLAVVRAVREPAWSPDGTRLAFVGLSAANQQWGLYVAEPGEALGAPVVESEMQIYAPAWSPDGQKLLFHRARENKSNPNMEIYVVNVDGSGLAALTDNEGYDGEGRFSPDGKQIVFVSVRGTYRDIYVMNADGSNQQALTHANRDDISPDWSPDGRWIVFASDRVEQGVEQIFIMRADGGSQCRLTQSEDSTFSPRWSPDGRWIIYLNVSREAIYRVQPDGSGETAIPVEQGVRPLTVDWGSQP